MQERHTHLLLMHNELHVVVGAGQIGPLLVQRLLARGHRVRVVRRSAGAVPGVELARGDVADVAFAAEAMKGAAVVYHCANPARYDSWDQTLVPLARGVREGAARVGAKLVVLDNLYMYGPAPGGVLVEDSPYRPCSHKGELRARLAEELSAAHARGDVRATTGRAADFFGARCERALLGERFLTRLARGKAVEVFGDPELPRAYAYVGDVAEGLAVLGGDDRALGRSWLLPHASNESTRALVERFAARLGVTARLRRIPSWMLRAIGLLNGQVREMVEMQYQWEAPFTVDDSAFHATFAVPRRPIDEIVRETLAEQELSARAA